MKDKLLLLIICIANFSMYAQNINIHGKVLDDNKHILSGASIALYLQDSILIAGTTSNEKGTFILENIEPNNYKISVSYVGFLKENIDISQLTENLDLGNIVLQSDAILGDLVVTASNKHYEVNRQIILPSKEQMEVSNNALTLTRNLQLSLIQINPVTNDITTFDGKDVILQINGVKVEKNEIMALKSKDILRVEYLDQPGARYEAGAVINYVVKQREQGGYITANAKQTLANVGVNQYAFSGNYNWNRSQIGFTIECLQNRAHWIRENEYEYNFMDKSFERSEKGLPTKYKESMLNASVKYTLSETDKYLFSATLRNNFNDVPNQFSNRQGYANTSNSSQETFFQDFSTWKENVPSLDLYYQHNLEKRQLLIFNIVGTYINSKSTHTYNESINNNSISNINSSIDGNKYSIIAEAIYEKDFKDKGKLSVGVRHNQSKTENDYSGDIISNVNLKYSESYIFADYMYSKNKFSLNAGISGKYTYYKQDEVKYKHFNPQPRLQMQYSFPHNINLRYHIDLQTISPSIGNLNHIEQEVDLWQIKRGNPYLVNAVNCNQNIRLSYNGSKYIGVELLGFYYYGHNPMFETFFPENEKIIAMYQNHKKFHRFKVASIFNVRPFGNYITLNVMPMFSRDIMKGNAYTHTYSSFFVMASLLANYNRWYLYAQAASRNKSLMGETISYGENYHFIEIGYNADKWNVSAGVTMPFVKEYSQSTRTLSEFMYNYSKVYTNNLQAKVYISASINLDFGKRKSAQRQRINNQDSGSGVLQSGKISM